MFIILSASIFADLSVIGARYLICYFLDLQDMWPLLCGLIALLSVFFVYKLLDFILHLPRVSSHSDKHIFITGCDSGFGHRLAKRLDLLGCHVFAGCFTEKGETELKKVCSERLLPVPLDVTDHDSITRAFEVISSKLLSSGNGGRRSLLSKISSMLAVTHFLYGHC